MDQTKPLCRVWIVGFAGHRVIRDPSAIKLEIVNTLREIRDGIEGELTGRSSAAAGADLLFLEACVELGISYSVVLPFPEERFREDFDDGAEWERARTLIAGAAYVELAPGNQPAPEAYHLAAREVIEVSDAMIFVWDGEPARGIGGTAETVTEARESRLPHRIIDAIKSTSGPLEYAEPFPWRDKVFSTLPGLRDVDQLFDELDRRAVQGAPLYRWFLAGSITLNQLAPVLYAALVTFSLLPAIAPVVRLLLVLAAACLPWIGARCRINNQWVDHRIRAELLRSLRASHAFSAPFRPFAEELFGSDMPFLRSLSWRMVQLPTDWMQERDRYLSERLDGQIRYLLSKGLVAKARFRTFQTIFKISSIGALILGAAAILRNVYEWQVPQQINQVFLVVLPVILPAVAAWCLSMISIFEHKRRAELNILLVERLRSTRAALADAKSKISASAAIARCERLLLAELWEWGGARGRRD